MAGGGADLHLNISGDGSGAEGALDRVQAKIDALHGKTVEVNVRVNDSGRAADGLNGVGRAHDRAAASARAHASASERVNGSMRDMGGRSRKAGEDLDSVSDGADRGTERLARLKTATDAVAEAQNRAQASARRFDRMYSQAFGQSQAKSIAGRRAEAEANPLVGSARAEMDRALTGYQSAHQAARDLRSELHGAGQETSRLGQSTRSLGRGFSSVGDGAASFSRLSDSVGDSSSGLNRMSGGMRGFAGVAGMAANAVQGLGLAGVYSTIGMGALTAGVAAVGLGSSIGVIAKSAPMMSEVRRGMRDFGDEFQDASSKAAKSLPQMVGLRQETTRLAGTLASVGVGHLSEGLATATGLTAQFRGMVKSLEPAISPSLQAAGALGGALMGALGNSTPVITSFANTLTQSAPGLQSVAESVIGIAGSLGEATVKLTAAAAPMAEAVADFVTPEVAGAALAGTGGAALGGLIGGGIGLLGGGVGAVPGALIGAAIGGTLLGSIGYGEMNKPDNYGGAMKGSTGKMVPTVGGGMIAEFPEAFNPDFNYGPGGQTGPNAGQKSFSPGQAFAWDMPQPAGGVQGLLEGNYNRREGESRGAYEQRQQTERRYGREAPPAEPGHVPVGKPVPGGGGSLAPAGTPGQVRQLGPVGAGRSVGDASGLNQLAQQFSQTGQNAQTAGNQINQGMATARAGTQGTAPALQSQMQGAQQAVQQAGSQIPPAANQAFSAVNTAAAQVQPAPAIQPAMKSAVSAVSDQSGAMADAGSSLGSSIGSGAAQGTTKSFEIVDTVIKKRVLRVIEEAAGTLDAHSPSRKFVDLFMSTGQGAAIGVERSFGAAVNAAGNMTGKVVDSAGAQLGSAGAAAGQRFAGQFAGQIEGGGLSQNALTGNLSGYLQGSGGGTNYVPTSPDEQAAGAPSMVKTDPRKDPASARREALGKLGYSQSTIDRRMELEKGHNERKDQILGRAGLNQELAKYRAETGFAGPIDTRMGESPQQAAARLRQESALGRADLQSRWAEGSNPIADQINQQRRDASGLPPAEATSRLLESRGVDIGRSLPEGMTKGIKESEGQTRAAYDAMNQGLIDDAKKKHKTQSPSKVSAQLGRNIGTGIRVGVESGTAGAMGSIDIIANNAGLLAGHEYVKGFDGAMNHVIDRKNLESLARPQIDSDQAEAWLGAMGLLGPAGSGAQVMKSPSVTIGGTTPQTIQNHITLKVDLDGRHFRDYTLEQIDQAFEQAADQYQGAFG